MLIIIYVFIEILFLYIIYYQKYINSNFTFFFTYQGMHQVLRHSVPNSAQFSTLRVNRLTSTPPFVYECGEMNICYHLNPLPDNAYLNLN